jgi:cysteine protease ATG4
MMAEVSHDSPEWHSDGRDNTNNDKSKRKLVHMYINGKSKIMASVYNIYRRHPSNPAPFSLAPIVLLGNCYQCDSTIAQFHYINDSGSKFLPSLNKNNNNSSPHVAKFLKDFASLLWFSYRKDFPPIGPAAITSDIGWGCMLRTGQMMLAEALIIHFLGREWRLTEHDLQPYSTYRQVLRLFADVPGPTSPFSLHNIVHKNKAMTPVPDSNYKGEVWFAPSLIAKVLRSLVHVQGPDSFAMFVPIDGVVSKDRVATVCTQKREETQQRVNIHSINGDVGHDGWRSVFILVPLRLGVDKINPIYYNALYECLQMPHTVGIIGGRPKQSFYFVGFQEEYLIYLDPHIVHDTVHPDKEFSNETYHCRAPQKIHISEVDPSLAVGFYCRDRQDFEQFWAKCKQLEQEMDFIFTVTEEQPSYGSDDDEDMVIV